MAKKILLFIILAIVIFSTGVMGASAQDEDLPVVRIILFFSPTCPHCQKVINEVIPPLKEQYGEQLYILYINTATQGGGALFMSTLTDLNVPPEQAGVPFMIVGSITIVGDTPIEEQLPGVIEAGLAAGGVDWPEAPSLISALTASGFIDPETGQAVTPTPAPTVEVTPTTEVPTDEPSPTETQVEAALATTVPEEKPTEEPTSTPLPTATPTTAPTKASGAATDGGNNEVIIQTDLPNDGPPVSIFELFMERFNLDPTANSIAVLVLLFMIGELIWIGVQFMQASTPKLWPEFILPILLVAGLGIAIYLATIEVSGNEAICGPVGDCNAVQQSQYAKVFGIPVAILGIIGYLSIGASWLVARLKEGMMQFYARMAMFGFSVFGLVFFIYLTFLEPFVIGATCVWCISSAIIFSLINLSTTPVALNAWAEMEIDLDEDYDDDDIDEDEEA